MKKKIRFRWATLALACPETRDEILDILRLRFACLLPTAVKYVDEEKVASYKIIGRIPTGSAIELDVASWLEGFLDGRLHTQNRDAAISSMCAENTELRNFLYPADKLKTSRRPWSGKVPAGLDEKGAFVSRVGRAARKNT